MTELPGLGGDTQAYDINTHGHIVGSANDSEDNRHAFVYKDGHLMDLYKMIPAADKENWKELREAYSISDDGVVVGRGRFWTDKAEDKSASRAYRIQL
jgi:probable HAF family extracellular repeat protein